MEDTDHLAARPATMRTRSAAKKEVQLVKEENARKKQKLMFSRSNQVMGPHDIVVNTSMNKIKIENDEQYDNAALVVKQEASDDKIVYVKEEVCISLNMENKQNTEKAADEITDSMSEESSSSKLTALETGSNQCPSWNFQFPPEDLVKVLEEKDAQIDTLNGKLNYLMSQIKTETLKTQDAVMELNGLRVVVEKKDLEIERMKVISDEKDLKIQELEQIVATRTLSNNPSRVDTLMESIRIQGFHDQKDFRTQHVEQQFEFQKKGSQEPPGTSEITENEYEARLENEASTPITTCCSPRTSSLRLQNSQVPTENHLMSLYQNAEKTVEGTCTPSFEEGLPARLKQRLMKVHGGQDSG